MHLVPVPSDGNIKQVEFCIRFTPTAQLVTTLEGIEVDESLSIDEQNADYQAKIMVIFWEVLGAYTEGRASVENIEFNFVQGG